LRPELRELRCGAAAPDVRDREAGLRAAGAAGACDRCPDDCGALRR